MFRQFKFAELAEFDGGRLREAFDLELQKVVADCDNRPGIKKDREVHLVLRVAPGAGEAGQMEETLVDFQIKSKMPARQSSVHKLTPRKSQKGPMLVFEDQTGDATQPELDNFGPRPGDDD